MSLILVVDDEPTLVATLTFNLNEEGYEVIAASNGGQAVEAVRKSSPDLVILDLMLGEMHGFEVCRTLRKESNIPIVILTARTDEVDKIVGLELGADDYMTKPFSMKELLARVRARLRRRDEASAMDREQAPQFFFTVDGTPLSVHAVQEVILKAKRRTGISRLHPHLLRHTFAIHYLMAGGDVFSLQKILGHSTLEVTRIYVNMVSSQVKEKHRLYSPMDNLPLKSERGGKKPVKAGARLWRVK